jgi:hypothetical protein
MERGENEEKGKDVKRKNLPRKCSFLYSLHPCDVKKILSLLNSGFYLMTLV